MLHISPSVGACKFLVPYFFKKTVYESRWNVFLTLCFLRRYSSKVGGTHYDTLEITSQATQGEIKEAYYKLSKQYHPDRNKAENAKRRFQNISEAYEVLKDNQSRKRYDRSIMVKEKVVHHSMRTVYEKPVSMYTAKVHPQNMKTFNFDEWYQQHYGYNTTRIYKRQRYSKYQQPYNIGSQDGANFILSFMLAMFSLYLLLKAQKSSERNQVAVSSKCDSK